MSRCACGADHDADRIQGAALERHSRAMRWGVPFDRIEDEAILGNGVELRAKQTESGAWEASVYRSDYASIPMCEVGTMEFVGYAATRERAEDLARGFGATLLRTWREQREKWAAESAAREAERAAQS